MGLKLSGVVCVLVSRWSSVEEQYGMSVGESGVVLLIVFAGIDEMEIRLRISMARGFSSCSIFREIKRSKGDSNG